MKIANFILILVSAVSVKAGIQIVVFGVGDCDEPVDNSDIIFEATLTEDPKAFKGSLVLPFDIAGDDLFHMIVHQQTEGQWKTVKEMDGELSAYIGEFLSKAWDKLKDGVDPKVTEDYGIPQGSYTWEGIQIASDDVEVPSGMIGRFRLDVSIYKDDEPVICRGIDLETSMD